MFSSYAKLVVLNFNVLLGFMMVLGFHQVLVEGLLFAWYLRVVLSVFGRNIYIHVDTETDEIR